MFTVSADHSDVHSKHPRGIRQRDNRTKVLAEAVRLDAVSPGSDTGRIPRQVENLHRKTDQSRIDNS